MDLNLSQRQKSIAFLITITGFIQFLSAAKYLRLDTHTIQDQLIVFFVLVLTLGYMAGGLLIMLHLLEKEDRDNRECLRKDFADDIAKWDDARLIKALSLLKDYNDWRKFQLLCEASVRWINKKKEELK